MIVLVPQLLFLVLVLAQSTPNVFVDHSRNVDVDHNTLDDGGISNDAVDFKSRMIVTDPCRSTSYSAKDPK